MSKRKADASLKSSTNIKKSKLEFKKPVEINSEKSIKPKKSKKNQIKNSPTHDLVKKQSCGWCKKNTHFSDEYISDIIFPGFVYCNIDCLNKYRDDNWIKQTDIYDDDVSIYTIQNGCFQKCKKPLRDEETGLVLKSEKSEKSKKTANIKAAQIQSHICDLCDGEIKKKYFQDENFNDTINDYTCEFCSMHCLNLYRESNTYDKTNIDDDDISIYAIDDDGKSKKVEKPKKTLVKPKTKTDTNANAKEDDVKNDRVKNNIQQSKSKIAKIVKTTSEAIDKIVKKYKAKSRFDSLPPSCDYCEQPLNPNYAYTKDDTIFNHEFCDRVCLDLFRQENGMKKSKSKNVHLYLDDDDEVAKEEKEEGEKEKEKKDEPEKKNREMEKEEKKKKEKEKEEKKETNSKQNYNSKIWTGPGALPKCSHCFYNIRVCYFMDDEISELSSKYTKFGRYFCNVKCINLYRVNHGLSEIKNGDEQIQCVHAFIINTVTGKSISTLVDHEQFRDERKAEKEETEKRPRRRKKRLRRRKKKKNSWKS